MTVAICINCGRHKEGSFTKCPRCDFAPVSDLELAYSLAFSDSNFPPDALARIGADIAKTGTCPPLPEDQEAAFRKKVATYKLKNIVVADNRETNEAAAAKSEIPAEDFAHLQRLPLLVFRLVAGADAKVDRKELAAFKNLMRVPICRDTFGSPLFKSLIYFGSAASGDRKAQKLTDAYLTQIRSILDKHLSPEQFNEFREDVLTFGSIIAAASGGVLGLGNKVSKAEKVALYLLESYFPSRASASGEYSPVLSATTEAWVRKFDGTMFKSFGFRPSKTQIGVYTSSVQDFVAKISLHRPDYLIERGEILHKTSTVVGLAPDDLNALLSKQAPLYVTLTRSALRAVSASDKAQVESALKQLAWEFHDKCYRRDPVGHVIELITVLAPTMMEFTFETLSRMKSRR
ncbi:MAG: hypothetical protein AB7F74_07420 [Parvibaculaceae bacterium]